MSKTSHFKLGEGFAAGGLLDEFIPSFQFKVPPPSIDDFWMREALKEAHHSVGLTSPNPSVGCVLVDSNGKEISRGATQAYPGLHAERVAFNQVNDFSRLQNGTAYVTLEPCSHFGKQPPCVDLLVDSPIQRVVISRGDPFHLVNGEGIQKLRAAGKTVEIGILRNESTCWNLPFFIQAVLKRPAFILKWAQTLDGQLADDFGKSKWISNPHSRKYTHWLRQKYDAILVGGQTVLSDLPGLDVRDIKVNQIANPTPIIFDPTGLCLNAPPQIQEQLRNKTFGSESTSGKKFLYLTKSSVWSATKSPWIANIPNGLVLPVLPESRFHQIRALPEILDSSEIQSFLGKKLQSILVEGGPKTLAALFEADLVDAIHLFIAPILSGGRENRVFLNRRLQDSKRYELISGFSLEQDTVLEMVSAEIRDRVFS